MQLTAGLDRLFQAVRLAPCFNRSVQRACRMRRFGCGVSTSVCKVVGIGWVVRDGSWGLDEWWSSVEDGMVVDL